MFAIPTNIKENDVINIDGKVYKYNNSKLKKMAIDNPVDVVKILEVYPKKEEVNTSLEAYPTKSELSTSLANYDTKSEITTLLGEYNTKSEITTTLGDYATKTELTNLGDSKLDVAGGKITGPIIGAKEKAQVLVAGTLDLNEGNLFTKTVTSNTTFTLTNISAIPNVVQSFILEITNGGNFIVTWWNNIKWDNGEIPELTAGGVDMLGFYTSDNGNTWRGVLLSKDSK